MKYTLELQLNDGAYLRKEIKDKLAGFDILAENEKLQDAMNDGYFLTLQYRKDSDITDSYYAYYSNISKTIVEHDIHGDDKNEYKKINGKWELVFEGLFIDEEQFPAKISA